MALFSNRSRIGIAPKPAAANQPAETAPQTAAPVPEITPPAAETPPENIDKPAQEEAPNFAAQDQPVPIDSQDVDFDEQLLMLTHKVHSVLVDELGGQQFKADDRERLRPVAEQVMNDVMKDEK